MWLLHTSHRLPCPPCLPNLNKIIVSASKHDIGYDAEEKHYCRWEVMQFTSYSRFTNSRESVTFKLFQYFEVRWDISTESNQGQSLSSEGCSLPTKSKINAKDKSMVLSHNWTISNRFQFTNVSATELRRRNGYGLIFFLSAIYPVALSTSYYIFAQLNGMDFFFVMQLIVRFSPLTTMDLYRDGQKKEGSGCSL